MWQLSLGCFLLAAFTGVLYRFGMIGYLPDGLGLENVRHAHSHLMFFGWAVPFPLVIILRRFRDKMSEPTSGYRIMRHSLFASLIFGLLAYPFFLFFGYHPVPVGSGTLPLSVICSGLVMLSWYGFMIGYLKARSLVEGESSQMWFDGALILLTVCTLGAWGVAVVQALAPSNYLLMKGLTHFFLATFTEGWVVLIILAIILYQLQPSRNNWKMAPHIALGCIALGAPLTFPYGISESLLNDTLLAVARLGGLLSAIGIGGVLVALWNDGGWKRASAIWVWPLSLIGIKALMQFTVSVLPFSFWLSDHALRILYLHILLLGAFTLVMAVWMQKESGINKQFYYLIVGSVLSVLISLVFPTSLWPVALSGSWIYYMLPIIALLPPLAYGAQWIKILQSKSVVSDA